MRVLCLLATPSGSPTSSSKSSRTRALTASQPNVARTICECGSFAASRQWSTFPGIEREIAGHVKLRRCASNTRDYRCGLRHHRHGRRSELDRLFAPPAHQPQGHVYLPYLFHDGRLCHIISAAGVAAAPLGGAEIPIPHSSSSRPSKLPQK